MDDGLKMLATVVVIIALVLVVLIIASSGNWQREQERQNTIIQQYAESGYEIPTNLIDICAKRSISGTRFFTFTKTTFISCLDEAGYRIVKVGNTEFQ